jgi:hypothetical protein
LVAVLLCFLLIGFLIFLYMLIVHPNGTLTVTYARQNTLFASGTVSTPVAQSIAAPTDSALTVRLRQLQDAHEAALISDDEFATKRAELLRGL